MPAITAGKLRGDTYILYEWDIAFQFCVFLRLTLPNNNFRGIAWAPACGKAISELVLDGACSSVNLRPFEPSRFTPKAARGGRGRKKKGQSVGEQW